MSDLYTTDLGSGPEITVNTAGTPVLTGGLDTAVYLSVFIPPFWNNRIVPAEQKYTSSISQAMQDTLTLKTARNVEESVRASLSWLLADGVATSVEIDSEIATRERLNIRIIITEPNRKRTTYRYGLNWAAQAIHIIEEGRK